MIPFVDLKRQNTALEAELKGAFERVLASGWVLRGPEVAAFEEELAQWFGARHAVAVGSGTDAVEISLRACGLAPGTEVPTTAMTAVATINAIEAAGGLPRLVDPDSDTRNTTHLGSDCGIQVHLFGLATMPDDPPAHVVEDLAHSMGATCQGRLAGTAGRVGAVSFYPTKCCGALGDGGALLTDDDEVAERARLLRHYGFTDDGDISMRGQNSRLSELQAAFLRVKLPRVHGWNERRREIAGRYSEALVERVKTPVEIEGSRAVYHVYVIEHPERDRIMDGLSDRGIGTMIHYPKAIHEYQRWSHLGEPGQFPVAERMARRVLSLPCFPELTDHEVDQVIDAVRDLT